MLRHKNKRNRRHAQINKATSARGFTLAEVMVALPLVALIFLGVMDLFIVTCKTVVRTTSAMFADMDAANSIQHVIDETREAQSFALPLENTFVVPAGFQANRFSTTLGGESINAAIELAIPPGLSPGDVGYQSGNPSTVSVKNSFGTDITVSPAPYNHEGASAQTLLIYRGDANGAADASSGTYLWEYSVEDGGASVRRALCKSVAKAPNAVQFVRPTTDPNSTTSPAEAFQVEVKIISGYYSPINGQQTNEETNGTSSSQLSGKCVYMRNHRTTAVPPTNANQQSSNNAFKFSN